MSGDKRYLTSGLPGTGGTIKDSIEDFCVEEIPLYLPCGEGEHLYTVIEKRGVTTLDAIRRLARALKLSERDVGYAGMKDARGVTRQTVSLPRVKPDEVLALELPGISVLSAVRHRNKLKLGHLAGNRFRIRVRGVVPDALSRAETILAVLARRGVPNRFGEQRYGVQGNSHLIGRAMLAGDWRAAVDLVIGYPEKVSAEAWRSAIEAYQRGELEASLQLFPGHCRTERDIIQRLVKRPDDFEGAFRAVNPRLKKLYLSACQSALFDRVVEARLDSLDIVRGGDLAWKHANGACFLVTDAAAEAPRAEHFEISPSGPLFGCRMTTPEGEEQVLEQSILADEGLDPAAFDLSGGLRMEGERRPLRVPLENPQASLDDGGLILEFSLPKGSYATAVLREIVKA
ncbi:tRNA pseudouridine(13) synthase TruD [Geobacter benzoatilyticus]|uniref:tRNA pseudouridine synthase D n=1 Tax=Geobacter benzoatilyticus TaxID=2815309 RepID=A0ABX7Q4K4_9BACT|nr:tRNA pseudouridine(13) synthase TruD [Geobacter benzoatilyticus]QSV46309.1 tRNA pseudouridine(13) synthase TruD [Geobacter benzoatilyticus]